MHATLRQSGPSESGRGIRGTFYPSEARGAGGSLAAVVPKVIVVVVAMTVVRTILSTVARKHGGSHMGRRRQMIADLHRELHADDAAATEAPAKA